MPSAGNSTLKSPQARYAARAAAALGYEFRSLDGDDGYLFEVRDGARRAFFAAGSGTPYTLNDARAASIARDKAFCAEVLRQADVPVLAGEMFFVTPRWRDMRSPGREPEDALAFAATATYPMFCKPLSASNGLYAEVIESADDLADYMTRVSREHFAILMQPYVRAPEYRVFVLDDVALFSYAKAPPRVTGDGQRTLAQLVAAAPRDAEAPPLKPNGRDERGAKLGSGDIPATGALITLDGPANRAAGGGASELQDGAPHKMAEIARAAAAAIGLRLAAVDMFDLGADQSDPLVIEVNSNPMIATLEDNGRWDLIERIWRANIEAALR